MKYLLIHNRYFHVSGPETYLFNIKNELEKNGHQIDIFTLNYSKNIDSDNKNLFPEPIGSNTDYSFKDQNLSLINKLKVVLSLFYRDDVYTKLNDLLSKNNYDGALVLQFWGKLSPSIFKALRKNKVPASLRISDFGLICGSNTLLKNNKHSEECINNNFGCIKNKCVDNSYLKSLINKSAQISFYHKYSKNINFIFTCKNTQNIFNRAGFKENTFHLPTFYPNEFILKKSCNSKKILYLGRVDEDKGLHEIIPLVPDSSEIIFEIWGSGCSYYLSKIKKIAKERNNKNIIIMGEIEHSKVKNLFQNSLFSIIPSQWHDNLPNSLIESLSNGVPVIAPNYGCFPEFIINNENGFLYKNYKDLRKILKKIPLLDSHEKIFLSSNATLLAKKTFSSKIHINNLIKIISRNNEKNN